MFNPVSIGWVFNSAEQFSKLQSLFSCFLAIWEHTRSQSLHWSPQVFFPSCVSGMRSISPYYVSFIVCGLGCALASPDYAIHERRDILNRDWVKHSQIERDVILPVRIGLTQSNLENGYIYLLDVSDPGSGNYGKYWTEAKVNTMFAPTRQTVESVVAWLNVSGIDPDQLLHSANKG